MNSEKKKSKDGKNVIRGYFTVSILFLKYYFDTNDLTSRICIKSGLLLCMVTKRTKNFNFYKNRDETRVRSSNIIVTDLNYGIGQSIFITIHNVIE